MDTQPPQQVMNKRSIHFPNGNQAQAIISPSGARAIDLLHLLDIPPPKSVVMIAGGASQMSPQLHPNLVQLFTQGIAQLAGSLEALIIDGGTEAGVMALMGWAVAQQQRRPTLLGVSPAGCVTYPGKPTETDDHERVPLDPNHSHFVLVEADEWGGETATMYELAEALSQSCPSVAVLIDGGTIAKTEVIYNVRQGRPIIIIEGSGRLADEIAQAWQGKHSSISDSQLAEITQQGNIHLFPLTSPIGEFVQLVQRLLAEK